MLSAPALPAGASVRWAPKADQARIRAVHNECRTWSCVRRVRHAKALRRARAIRREWRYYRTHPMPYCTWGPESGGNYRARNPVSTAAGKFQMLDTTFHAFGGPDFDGSHDAAKASRLVQERIARRVLRGQGIGAWVNC